MFVADRFPEEGDQIAAKAGKALPEKQRRYGICPEKEFKTWMICFDKSLPRKPISKGRTCGQKGCSKVSKTNDGKETSA